MRRKGLYRELVMREMNRLSKQAAWPARGRRASLNRHQNVQSTKLLSGFKVQPRTARVGIKTA
jgi:hypothetical protein